MKDGKMQRTPAPASNQIHNSSLSTNPHKWWQVNLPGTQLLRDWIPDFAARAARLGGSC